jgi:hypothetical protein
MKKSKKVSVVSTIVKRRAKSVSLRAKYDTEDIVLTAGFIEAIERLMEEECRMMQQHEPKNADCWTWGICTVNDIAHSRGLEFEFGGEPDKHQILKDRKKQFMVIVGAS